MTNEPSSWPRRPASRDRRPLHDHGHRVHDGLSWPRHSACSCPAAQPSLPPTRGGMRLAQQPGERIVAMVDEDLRARPVLTCEAFENAIRVNAAIGGSTNAVVHLLAIAGRVGVALELDDFDRMAARRAAPGQPDAIGKVPDGGLLLRWWLPGVMHELGGLLHETTSPSTGNRWPKYRRRECFNADVIRPVGHARPARRHGNRGTARELCAPRGPS